MTKELTEEEKVEKVIILCIKEAIAGELADDDNAASGAETIMQLIKSECKRFALECVPKEHNLCSSAEEYNDSLIWNACIEQMIKTIEDKSK